MPLRRPSMIRLTMFRCDLVATAITRAAESVTVVI